MTVNQEMSFRRKEIKGPVLFRRLSLEEGGYEGQTKS